MSPSDPETVITVHGEFRIPIGEMKHQHAINVVGGPSPSHWSQRIIKIVGFAAREQGLRSSSRILFLALMYFII
jgi:hypothetical protein